MHIGICGTGMVGQTLGAKFVALGHEVKLGSRSAGNETSLTWINANGRGASAGTFADAAGFGEIVFNCTNGLISLDALRQAGAENLKGKILIDCANPLVFPGDAPPYLSICNTDSLGEQIQRAFPETKVVKALNTLNCQLMVDPTLVKGNHDLFISGDDPEAKAKVTALLKEWLGWETIIDLGDIKTARGTEMLMMFWLNMMGLYKTPLFNYRIVR